MREASFDKWQHAFRLEKYCVFETQPDGSVLLRFDVRCDSTSSAAMPLTRRTVM